MNMNDTLVIDDTIDGESGSAEGHIVMAAFLNGEEESIGGEFKNEEDIVRFINSFKDNKKALDEFLPDRDYKDVILLFID